MNELSSTEFRKTYASLKEPVEVTVNGHVIGTWLPTGTPPISVEIMDSSGTVVARNTHTFNTRPFTPVPKVKK